MSAKPIVWITGASSGIGLALSQECSRRGMYVVLSARSKYKLETVKDSLAYPLDALVLPMDVTKQHEVDNAVSQLLDKDMIPHYLINNAGISQRSLIRDTLMQTYHELMDINYFGTIRVTKGILPFMQKQSSKNIAVISSIAGKVGAPQRSGYAASKHALHGFFDCLRAEIASSGIGVSIICPGYTQTDIDLNALGADGKPTNQRDHENQSGMTAAYLAKKTMDAILAGKQEVYIGGFEKNAVFLKRFFPGLLSYILKRKNRNSR